MKLTKARLITKVKPGLTRIGYTWFKDSITGYDGLFVKKISNNLFLSIGMIIHRFYDDKFTCDYYLSTTTCINCIWGDIPHESSRRPGELLTKEELFPLRNHDIWWNDADSVDSFLSIIKKTEPRMLGDIELIKKIDNSKDAQLLSKLARNTIKVKSKTPDVIFKYTPNRIIDNIPLQWFMAAEYVLLEVQDNVTNHEVRRLAADAYRQNVLDGI